ncbi:MAG: hypothetical protein ACRD2J_17600 [Thermoanaerobaculia bacterium]
MLRATGAVILGYIVIAAFIFATFSLTYFLLGPSFAFEPGTTETSSQWMAVAMVLNVIAAAIGAWVTAAVARERAKGAVFALAILILVFGVVSALLAMNAPAPVLPDRPLTTLEAAQYARQPEWYPFLVAGIGSIAILATGILILRRRAGGSADAPASAG